jgi:hypothetical protein
MPRVASEIEPFVEKIGKSSDLIGCCTDVQRRISSQIDRIDIRSIEEKVFDVLHETESTCLMQFTGEIIITTVHYRMVLQQ